MQDLIEIKKIGIKPYSVNSCWQGRRFKTKDFKDWEYNVLLLLPKQEMIKGECAIFFKFYLKSIVRGDLDNLIKPLLDICVKKGYIEDDRFIMEIGAKKIKREDEGFEIQIIKL